MGLATQVRSAVGQPSTVRIGVVESVFPLTVDVQGAVFTEVGTLGSYFPLVGDTVALLGQSPQSGSDPTSWLALGSMHDEVVVPTVPRTLQADSTANVSLPLALTDITGATITFDTTAPSTLVQGWFVADLNVIGATLSTVLVRPFLNGVAMSNQTQVILEMPVGASTGRWSLSNYLSTTVAAGTHTIKLQGQTAAGAANQVQVVSGNSGIMINIYG